MCPRSRVILVAAHGPSIKRAPLLPERSVVCFEKSSLVESLEAINLIYIYLVDLVTIHLYSIQCILRERTRWGDMLRVSIQFITNDFDPPLRSKGAINRGERDRDNSLARPAESRRLRLSSRYQSNGVYARKGTNGASATQNRRGGVPSKREDGTLHYLCAPPIACRDMRSRELRFTHMGTLATPLNILSARFSGEEEKKDAVPGWLAGVSITFADMSGWSSEWRSRIDASNLIGDLRILEIWQPYLIWFFWGGDRNLRTLENFVGLFFGNLILNAFKY